MISFSSGLQDFSTGMPDPSKTELFNKDSRIASIK
jgi:hypothetical protein